MSNSKRKEFMEKNKQQKGFNRVQLIFIAIVVLGGIGLWFMFANTGDEERQRLAGGNYFIGENRDYQGQVKGMTIIEYQVADGQISFPLSEVLDKELVYMVHRTRQGMEVPLMSYISPEGRLVTAFAVCEPCLSLSFHMDGNELVCDSCGTRWHLNDLSGIVGGCLDYPPEEIPYQVQEGQVLVELDIVENWTPRV